MVFIYAVFHAWFYVIILMAITWLFYLKTGLPYVVDIAWSFVITFSGLYLALSQPLSFYSACVLLLLIFWGARLFIYLLLTRLIKRVNDTRYNQISESWSKSKKWGFFWHYQFQGILAVLISLPLYWVPAVQSFSILRLFILIVLFAAIVCEWVSDYQLYMFQNSDKSKGVCKIGFWSWCRHPNCFFEGNVWVFLFLSSVSISSLGSLIGVVSPVLVYWIMVGITIPITEKKSLASRGKSYQEYIYSTPRFLPWKNSWYQRIFK